MTSPSFTVREIIDMEHEPYQLLARIFQALADRQSFAVAVRVHDGAGKLLQVYFYSDEADKGSD